MFSYLYLWVYPMLTTVFPLIPSFVSEHSDIIVTRHLLFSVRLLNRYTFCTVSDIRTERNLAHYSDSVRHPYLRNQHTTVSDIRQTYQHYCTNSVWHAGGTGWPTARDDTRHTRNRHLILMWFCFMRRQGGII